MEFTHSLLGFAFLQLVLSGTAVKASCRTGWLQHEDICYLVSKETVIWLDAERECRDQNGYLLHYIFFPSMLAHEKLIDVPYFWIDQIYPLLYSDWNCPSIKNATLRLEKCSARLRFICQAKPEEDTTTQPDIGSPCHEGIGVHRHSCYWLANTSLTRDDSMEACERKGGHLVNIDDNTEESYLAKVLLYWPGTYWLGLKRHGDHLVWDNNKILHLSMAPWTPGQPAEGSGDCVIAFSQAKGREAGGRMEWTIGSCSSSYFGICEMELNSTSLEVSTSTVLPYWLNQYCPYKWISFHHPDVCYWLSDMNDLKTWSDARYTCRKLGGHLIYLQLTDANYLSNQRPSKVSSLWIGGPLFNKGSQISPENDNSTESSLCQAMEYPRILEVNCSEPLRYVCFAKKTEALPIPPELSNPVATSASEPPDPVATSASEPPDPVATSASEPPDPVATSASEPPDPVATSASEPPVSTCEEPWKYFNESCYRLISHRYTWQRTSTFCSDNGGHLVSITSPEEMDFVNQMVKSLVGRAWIGLNALGLDSSFEWTDGSIVDYVNWNKYEPNNILNQEKCVHIDMPRGGWNDENCNAKLKFICEKPRFGNALPATAPTTPRPGNCPTGWFPMGNKCFTLIGTNNEDRRTWRMARNECMTIGDDLASIHSQEEQVFMESLLMQYRLTAWIGLHDIVRNSKFFWTDNSEVNFVNWAPNEPSDQSNEDDCVEIIMYDKNMLGKWNVNRCNVKRAFLCQMYKDPTISTPGPDLYTCSQPDGWKRFGSSCYQLFNSPTEENSWFGAETYCRKYRGHLITIQNDFIFQFLKFNQDSSMWIGLKEGKNNRFEWSSQWPVVYTKWGKDKPAIQRPGAACVFMSNDGQWQTSRCRTKRPFICEVSTEVIPTLSDRVEGICPQDNQEWLDIGGKFCYYVETKKLKSWSNANADCHDKGAALASIHSPHEVASLAIYFKPVRVSVWIGLARNHDGGFAWSDGSPVEYVKWAANEPNNPNEKCVDISWDSTDWNDARCSMVSGYVCKVEKIIPNITIYGSENLSSDKNSKLSSGSVAGIVIACFLLIIIVAVVGTIRLRRPEKDFFLLPAFKHEPMGYVNAVFSRGQSGDEEVMVEDQEKEETN